MKFAEQTKCYTSPEPWFHFAQAHLHVEKMSSVEKGEVAELVYDSSRAGPTAGIRSGAAFARQLLYKAGNLCIDMCLQPKPGTEAVVLVGQLLDSRRPDRGIKDVPVRLLREGNTISDQKTNQVGEFEFGIGTLYHLKLAFVIEGRKSIIVPLPDSEA